MKCSVGTDNLAFLEARLSDLHCNEPLQEISNIVVCAVSKGSDQPAHTRSLVRALTSRLNIL